jgi:hypothetical protein
MLGSPLHHEPHGSAWNGPVIGAERADVDFHRMPLVGSVEWGGLWSA